jgi:hypothetical protein
LYIYCIYYELSSRRYYCVYVHVHVHVRAFEIETKRTTEGTIRQCNRKNGRRDTREALQGRKDVDVEREERKEKNWKEKERKKEEESEEC